MDNLTHSLVGALFGQAGLKKKTGLAMPALIIGANLPDIDGTCLIYHTQSLAMRREILFPQGDGWWARSWSLPDGLGKPEHLWFSMPCALPGEAMRKNNADLAAFLFWSRAPFAEIDPSSGGTLMEDARFAGRTPGGQFAVVLPELACRPPGE